MATTSTTQPNTGLRPTVKPIDWGRWLYRLLATSLVLLGLGLLAAELNALPPEWMQAVSLAGPVLLLLAGAGLAVWGLAGGRQALPYFAIERGTALCGEVMAATGGADLALRAFAGSSQLAVGQLPSGTGPRLDLRGTAARLTLSPQLFAALSATDPWSVALAKGLPWDLTLRAGGGHLDLDLRDLTIASLRVNSAFGNVALILPAQGAADLQLRLALGDLIVVVPEGVEVRLKLAVSPLVNVSVAERRFINVAPGEWTTPLYATTTQRCTVLVDMSAGDLRLT